MAESRPFEAGSKVFVRQRREWLEIAVDWETRNQYDLLDAHGQSVGMIVERAGGWGDTLRRLFFRSHRRLEAQVLDAAGEPILRLERPFFWLFSNLSVTGADGRSIGRVKRRFGIVYKRYDLLDATERVFARVASPLWRLWRFPIEGAGDARRAEVSKRWGGLLREAFADADGFLVDCQDASWSEAERWVILAASVSIDFDFFENNQGISGLLSFLPGGN